MAHFLKKNVVGANSHIDKLELVESSVALSSD